MSELFETYEREFCDLSGAITCDLNDLQTGAARSKAGALEAKFATLQESLRNMEVELASLPAAKKAQLSVRLRNFQANANNLKKEFEKAKTAAGRKELVGGSANRYISPQDEDHRERLQANTDRLSKQNETLKNARRLVAEMEDLGEDTSSRLRQQREGMERTLGTVRETNQEMTRTRKILSMIQRRSLMNKLIIIAVILVLTLTVFLIVYFKWIAPLFNNTVTPPPTTPPMPSPSPSVADGGIVAPPASSPEPLPTRRAAVLQSLGARFRLRG